MPLTRDDVVGRSTGKAVIVVERGPLTRFAEAVTESSPIYRRREAAEAAGFADIPAPPTWSFSAATHWGAFPEDQPADANPESNPMMEIMGELLSSGGMILHGEQEFTYHQPIIAGDRLTSEATVVDYYAKESGERTMTFVVTETTYRDEAGELVLTARMNLIHRS
jgi:acyl dehydratase